MPSTARWCTSSLRTPEASEQADLDAIRALVESYSGGFGTLNATVKAYLQRWFESQGGVKVVARRGQATLRADGAQRAQQPDVNAPTVRRGELVPVARFAAGTSTSTASAAAAAAAAGAPVSMLVSNPAYNPAIATTRPPIAPVTRRLAPIAIRAPAGRSRAGGSRTNSEAARLLGPAAGSTADTPCVDVLPAASAGALSSVGNSVGRDRRDNGADGGYMEVQGTPAPPGRLESDVSLITDLGLGRQDSDVSLIAEPGLACSYMEVGGAPPPGRLDSDVSLIADPGCISRRLASASDL